MSVFLDTNILVYAVDQDAGEKHLKAKQVLAPFFQKSAKTPSISAQVLHEFAYKLYRWKLPQEQSDVLLAPLYFWNVVANDLSLFQSALEIRRAHQTSFWDSLILAAANRAGAKEIWSEDFNTGQSYDGVTAVNPFE